MKYLVDNVKDFWTWFSMQILTFALIWEVLPAETKDFLVPDIAEPYVTHLLIVAAMIARVIKQEKPSVKVPK